MYFPWNSFILMLFGASARSYSSILCTSLILLKYISHPNILKQTKTVLQSHLNSERREIGLIQFWIGKYSTESIFLVPSFSILTSPRHRKLYQPKYWKTGNFCSKFWPLQSAAHKTMSHWCLNNIKESYFTSNLQTFRERARSFSKKPQGYLWGGKATRGKGFKILRSQRNIPSQLRLCKIFPSLYFRFLKKKKKHV